MCYSYMYYEQNSKETGRERRFNRPRNEILHVGEKPSNLETGLLGVTLSQEVPMSIVCFNLLSPFYCKEGPQGFCFVFAPNIVIVFFLFYRFFQRTYVEKYIRNINIVKAWNFVNYSLHVSVFCSMY
uniref:Uncharacterized protein n=1 Tax=Cacopsylla melanoneura TaxID=428564 RepID=A0A8D9A677_9HEMI